MEQLNLTLDIDKYDIIEADNLLEELSGWLLRHTTNFGAAALILQGAIKQIEEAKRQLKEMIEI